MVQSQRRSFTAILLLFLTGCTVYTSCPESNANGAPPNEGPPANGADNGGENGGGDNGGGGNGGGMAGTDDPGSGGAIVAGPTPEGEWRAVTPDIGDFEVLCGPMSWLSSKPDEDLLIAGINQEGLWATRDGGETWEPFGRGEGSDPMVHGTTTIVYDPEDPDVFWEAGIYGEKGVFKTTDGGKTFKHLGDIWHNDYVTIDFTDPRRRTLLASGHEQQVLYKSVDGGETWEDIGAAIPEGTKVCSFPLIIDSKTYLLGCGGWYDEGKPAILRSEDGGKSFRVVHDDGGAEAPLVASDGSIYWPEEFGNGLVRSTDQGRTWTQVVEGTLLSVQPVELPDGRIASLTRDAVVVSADQGRTWRKVTAPLPYEPVGFVYSPFQKAFFVWYFTCRAEPEGIQEDAVMRFDWDFESE